MKFSPRPLGEAAEINRGTRWAARDYLRLAGIILAGFILVNLAIYALAEVAVRFVSLEQEAAWFGRWLAQEEHDPKLASYRDALDRLCEHPETPQLPYRLLRIEDPEPNAFALVGGAIGITDGLIEALDDDEIAIAFLLGHELGHFRNRDHLRGASRALLLAGCQRLFFPTGSSDMVLGMGYHTILSAYSRKQEEQADAFGLRLVYDCYGHGEGALRLLELLHQQQDIPEWAYMFTTHPGPEARIRRLRTELERITADASL